MLQKNNNVPSAEKNYESSANVEVSTSSPNNAKPNVGGRFSVSVVYQKIITGGTLESALRSAIIDANSEEEALGKLIYSLNKEMNNWNLALKCVLSV